MSNNTGSSTLIVVLLLGACSVSSAAIGGLWYTEKLCEWFPTATWLCFGTNPPSTGTPSPTDSSSSPDSTDPPAGSTKKKKGGGGSNTTKKKKKKNKNKKN